MGRWLLLWVVGTGACASSPSETNAVVSERAYSELRRRVEDEGQLRVIVGVRVDPGASPAAIRLAQDELLASLSSDHVELASRFEVIPFVVLRVDALGLDALIASRRVTSIEEDEPSPAARP